MNRNSSVFDFSAACCPSVSISELFPVISGRLSGGPLYDPSSFSFLPCSPILVRAILALCECPTLPSKGLSPHAPEHVTPPTSFLELQSSGSPQPLSVEVMSFWSPWALVLLPLLALMKPWPGGCPHRARLSCVLKSLVCRSWLLARWGGGPLSFSHYSLLSSGYYTESSGLLDSHNF